MGSLRKMSSSFKRGSLKSSTSGSQKVSEFCLAACGEMDRRTEGHWSPALPTGRLDSGLLFSADCGRDGVLGVRNSCIRTASGEVTFLSC